MFIPYPFIRFFLSTETFHSITNNGEELWDILHALNIRGIRCVCTSSMETFNPHHSDINNIALHCFLMFHVTTVTANK